MKVITAGSIMYYVCGGLRIYIKELCILRKQGTKLTRCRIIIAL